MGVGTSLGMYYDDEFHQAVEEWKGNKPSYFKQSLDSMLKNPGTPEDDMIRTPLEVSPETNPKDEMTPDYMQRQKDIGSNPQNIYNDSGEIVDYDRLQQMPSLPRIEPSPSAKFNEIDALAPNQPDFEGRFNNIYETPLNPKEEEMFQTWKQKYAPKDSGEDYDFRGAFKAGATPADNGHWVDTFKKPNHPTFSDQSQYAKDRPDLAGSWFGDLYVPPKTRLKN